MTTADFTNVDSGNPLHQSDTILPTPSKDVFAQGAGGVNGSKFLHPGLVYGSDAGEWRSFVAYAAPSAVADVFTLPIDTSNANQPSVQIGSLNGSQTVTREVTSTEAGTWTPSFEGMPGVDVKISPASLSFAAPGITQQYTITFTRTTAAYNAFSTGYLSWISAANKVARIPIAVRPMPGLERTVDEVSGVGADGSVPLDVRSSAAQTVATKVSSLTAGIRMPDPTLTSPAPSVPSGTGGTNSTRSYAVHVGADASIARFAITGTGTSDTDALAVTLWHGTGSTATLAATAKPQGVTKNLDVRNLPAGDYELRVGVTSAAASVSWNVTDYISTTPAATTKLTSDSPTLALVANTAKTMNVSWAGLKSGTSYLGDVEFTDAGLKVEPDWRTLVSITVPSAVTASVRSLELPPRQSPVAAGSTSNGTLVLAVTDTSTVGVGWSVSLLASPFVFNGGTVTGTAIPANNFTLLSSAVPTVVTGQLPGLGGPFAGTDASGTLDITRTVATAASGFGSGSYLQNLDVSLAVPASSTIGLYTATITVTTGNAP